MLVVEAFLFERERERGGEFGAREESEFLSSLLLSFFPVFFFSLGRSLKKKKGEDEKKRSTLTAGMLGHAIEFEDGSQRPRTKGNSGVGGSSPNTLIAPSMIRSGVSPILSSCCGESWALPLHRSLSLDLPCLASLTIAADAPPPPPTAAAAAEEEEPEEEVLGENETPQPGHS